MKKLIAVSIVFAGLNAHAKIVNELTEKQLLASIVTINGIECTNAPDVLSVFVTEDGVEKSIPSCKGFK